jgi:ABC-type Fe3+/spermidine/putrescine transport system ATPase subunit
MCRSVSSTAQPGDLAQVAIRPEHARVEVEADENAASGPNRLAGRIEALLFIGDHYEATLSLDVGQTVLGHLQAVDGWREGQRVTLSMRPEDVRVWSN